MASHRTLARVTVTLYNLDTEETVGCVSEQVVIERGRAGWNEGAHEVEQAAVMALSKAAVTLFPEPPIPVRQCDEFYTHGRHGWIEEAGGLALCPGCDPDEKVVLPSA